MTVATPLIQRLTPALAPRPERAGRYDLEHVSDEALHAEVKTLAGRYNGLTASLLAHLAEVDARGIYRERACSSLYTYCVYELRLSEDEAQRRVRAARTARTFPVLFEMLADGAIHLTGLLLLAPYLTPENHNELLARARFRTKREIEHLIAEIAPRPDVPARIEPLGPRPVATANLWQAYTASLRGPVRDLVPGIGRAETPPNVDEDLSDTAGGAVGVELPASAPVDVEKQPSSVGSSSNPVGSLRYRVEFTASGRYVELLEEARNLLQHQAPDRDVARIHELAMAAFVEQLRKRRQAASVRSRRATKSDKAAPARGDAGGGEDRRAAPARVDAGDGEGMRAAPARAIAKRRGEAEGARLKLSDAPAGIHGRYVPAEIRRAVWRRDAGRCTFEDSSGQRCRERAGLELHHEHAFALGGPTTLENLRLMCRSHNALMAERDFGREYVERVKSAWQK